MKVGNNAPSNGMWQPTFFLGARGKALAIEDALDHQYGRFKDFWREWA